MSLNGRIAKLERRLGVSGPCSTCGGRGWSAVVLINEKNPPDKPPEPKGCPECGTVRSLKRIVLCPRPSAPRRSSK